MILVAAVLVLLVLGVAFIAPALMGPFSAKMSGQWYKDGKPVGAPFGFINPAGAEVDTLRETVTWSATGANLDTTSFGLGGWVKVSIAWPYPSAEKTELDKFMITASGAAGMSGSTYCDFLLETLLADFMDWKEVGWSLVLEAALTAQVTDANGELLTETWTGAANYKLTWSTATSSFTLTGSVAGG